MNKEFSLTVVLDEQMENQQNWTTLHQCLLMLLDSPLNHAGYLEIYVKLVADERLVKLHREGCDMPVVQTKDGQTRLFQFVGKSLDKLVYNNKYNIYRISNLTPKLKNAEYFANNLDKKVLVYIEFGPVDFNILGDSREFEYEVRTFKKDAEEDTYSISRYPLSPSLTCVKLTSSFEKALDVF